MQPLFDNELLGLVCEFLDVCALTRLEMVNTTLAGTLHDGGVWKKCHDRTFGVTSSTLANHKSRCVEHAQMVQLSTRELRHAILVLTGLFFTNCVFQIWAPVATLVLASLKIDGHITGSWGLVMVPVIVCLCMAVLTAYMHARFGLCIPCIKYHVPVQEWMGFPRGLQTWKSVGCLSICVVCITLKLDGTHCAVRKSPACAMRCSCRHY